MRTKDGPTHMEILPLECPPTNMAAFTNEIAGGIARLYGESAAGQYRTTARRGLEATLRHPAVWGLRIDEDNETLAYVLALVREGAGQLPFMHVLQHAVGRGLEARLFEEAVERIHARHPVHILCEIVDFAPLELGPVAAKHGFQHVARTIMVAEAKAVPPPDNPPPLSPQSLGPAEWERAARCLVDAYAREPGRNLHIEVCDTHRALGFISRVAAGHFGRVLPDYLLVAMDGEHCAGTILGCEVGPETGFVLQVVVEPAYRGQGLARMLIVALAGAFARNGMRQIGLGVTCDNPARRLYARLGFEEIRPVNAYVWWADQGNDAS